MESLHFHQPTCLQSKLCRCWSCCAMCCSLQMLNIYTTACIATLGQAQALAARQLQIHSMPLLIGYCQHQGSLPAPTPQGLLCGTYQGSWHLLQPCWACSRSPPDGTCRDMHKTTLYVCLTLVLSSASAVPQNQQLPIQQLA
jgi:hypothetical protein